MLWVVRNRDFSRDFLSCSLFSTCIGLFVSMFVRAWAVVTSIAGSGVATFGDATGTLAGFVEPVGLTIDPLGNLFVADLGNRVRKITPAGGASATAKRESVSCEVAGDFG
jgi:hypothetical protein